MFGAGSGDPLLAARTHACAAVLDGVLYVMGDQTWLGNGIEYLCSVECLRDGKWQTAPDLQAEKRNLASCYGGIAANLRGVLHFVDGLTAKRFCGDEWQDAARPPIATAPCRLALSDADYFTQPLTGPSCLEC